MGVGKGATTKFRLRGRVHGHPNPPTPKFIFSSDFGHFILNMLDYSNNLHMSRKKLLKYHNFWGASPANFSTAGDASPTSPPPRFRRPWE